jgi:hypothetical protein
MSERELTGICERRGCDRPAAVKVHDRAEEMWFGACRDCAQQAIAEYDILEVDADA